MSLKSLIIQLGSDKTASELVSLLNSPSVEVRDDQLYTWSGVVQLVGIDNANTLTAVLQSSAPWALYQLGGKGLQLSNALTQGMLAQLMVDGMAFCQTLKDTGIHYVSPFVRDGGAGTVSEQDVQTVLNEIALEETKRQLLSNANDQWNAFVASVEAWDGSGDPPVMGG